MSGRHCSEDDISIGGLTPYPNGPSRGLPSRRLQDAEEDFTGQKQLPQISMIAKYCSFANTCLLLTMFQRCDALFSSRFKVENSFAESTSDLIC